MSKAVEIFKAKPEPEGSDAMLWRSFSEEKKKKIWLTLVKAYVESMWIKAEEGDKT